MIHKKGYKRAVVVGLLLLACVSSIRVQAEGTGTIRGMSEKVYADKSTESSVIGNIIAGGTFTILSSESDTEGRAWYRIRTGMGAEGYLPAESVARTGSDMEEESGEGEAGADNGEAAAGAENDGGGEAGTGEGAGGTGNNREGQNQGDKMTGRLRTTDRVNVREYASTEGVILGEIPRDTVLDYTGIQENEMGETWYEVTYGEIHGYIRESTVDEIGQPNAGAEGGTGREPDRSEEDDNRNQPETSEEDTGTAQTGTSEEDNDMAQSEMPSNQVQSAGNLNAGQGEMPAGVQPGKDTAAAGKEDRKMEEAEESRGGLIIDGVVITSFLGCLLCLAAIYYLAGQMKKIYKGKNSTPVSRGSKKRKGKKECSTNQKKKRT